MHLTTSPASVTCCHCGRDYAREYWAMSTAGDPLVCKSCRRDTNPDAADAPRGGPPTPETVMPLGLPLVVAARKQCRMCGGEWDGLIFGAAPQGLPLPFGICPACSAKDDAHMAALSARVVPMGMPLPELSRPRRTETDD